MQPAEFEPSIPAMDRPQIYATDSVATGIIFSCFNGLNFLDRSQIASKSQLYKLNFLSVGELVLKLLFI